MNNDLNQSITILRKVKNKSYPSEPVRYNSIGENDEKLSKKFLDSESVAIHIPTTTGQLYKIKSERNGKFFNPLKVTSSYFLGQLHRDTKDPRFQYKIVTESSFKYYLQFLHNKYDSSLTVAEREA